MPKLSDEVITLDLDNINPAAEGQVLSDVDLDLDQIIISSQDLDKIATGITKLQKVYFQSLTEAVTKSIQDSIRTKLNFAEIIGKIVDSVNIAEQINVIIRTPIVDAFSSLNSLALPQVYPTQIVIVPDQVFPRKQKSLPSPKRKQLLPLTAVSTEKDGFIVNDRYINGMTKHSQAGKLFQIIIHPSLEGTITDELIGRTLNVDPKDYEAWGTVFRDLKRILNNNNLELPMKRSRAIKQYAIKGITQRIRKRKKTKKAVKISKFN